MMEFSFLVLLCGSLVLVAVLVSRRTIIIGADERVID